MSGGSGTSGEGNDGGDGRYGYYAPYFSTGGGGGGGKGSAGGDFEQLGGSYGAPELVVMAQSTETQATMAPLEGGGGGGGINQSSPATGTGFRWGRCRKFLCVPGFFQAQPTLEEVVEVVEDTTALAHHCPNQGTMVEVVALELL